jgi:hypothetical protein
VYEHTGTKAPLYYMGGLGDSDKSSFSVSTTQHNEASWQWGVTGVMGQLWTGHLAEHGGGDPIIAADE